MNACARFLVFLLAMLLLAAGAPAAAPPAPIAPDSLQVRRSYDEQQHLRAEWTVRTTPEGETVRHGRFLRYHANGRTAVVGAYRDGKPVGVWRWYDADGALLRTARQEGDYEEVLQGRELARKRTVFRTLKGVKVAEGLFKRDQPHGMWHYYYPDGAPKAEGRFLVGIPDGRWTYYYRTGQIERIQEYKLGVPHGLMREGYPNGQERYEGHFDQGLRVGRWRAWYANGQLEYEGDYVEDARDGEWRVWSEAGTLLRLLRYRAGTLVEEVPLPHAKAHEPVIPDAERLPPWRPRIYDEGGREIRMQNPVGP